MWTFPPVLVDTSVLPLKQHLKPGDIWLREVVIGNVTVQECGKKGGEWKEIIKNINMPICYLAFKVEADFSNMIIMSMLFFFQGQVFCYTGH